MTPSLPTDQAKSRRGQIGAAGRTRVAPESSIITPSLSSRPSAPVPPHRIVRNGPRGNVTTAAPVRGAIATWSHGASQDPRHGGARVGQQDKNRENQRKHGVSFEEARTVFYDDKAIEFYDDEHSDREDRFLLLGVSSFSRILMVCH